jgi:murein tripeptide amidase MpaA
MTLPETHFDRFYRFEELTETLRAYVNEYPNLIHLESIGKSHEGRDIWLVTVTNFSTGIDSEKPAMYVDGNIHAGEVSASVACLYHINNLVTNYESNPQIKECLDTRVFYIVPRVNPDGAEWALADRPKLIRSSTRPYPFDEEPFEGLVAWEDIDGDGRILMMRVPDPNGSWKKHPDEPRLLIRRDPIETGGTYFRLLPEGRIRNFDGIKIQVAEPKEGLDLNRNFPMEWRQENEQRGAGPYPASEPEVRAIIQFFTKHNNISSVLTFHTMSGVILRPYSSKADEAFPTNDLWTYQKIGQKGTEITSYPNISIFHDFRYHPKQVITGGFDWAYEHLGMFFWVVELWSPQKQAGIKEYKFIDWYREHPIEDDIKLIQWSDKELAGKGYVSWYPYQHPELGEVELGGWDWMYFSNIAPHLLESEIKPFSEWLTWHALISPKLSLRQLDIEGIGEDVYRLRIVIENTGWLPTNVTEKALEKKVVRGVIVEIQLPEKSTLLTGKIREEFKQLTGRAYVPASASDTDDSTSDRLKVEWIIHAPQGSHVKVFAHHDRAGVIKKEIKLI